MNTRSVVLLICSLVLTGSGLAVLWVNPITDLDHRLFQRQCIWTLAGFAMLLCCSRINYRIWGRIVFPTAWLAIVCLLLVFVPPIGASIYGSKRWMHVGPILVQPSSLAIFALIIFFASYHAGARPNLRRLLESVCLPVIFCTLIVMELDLATAFLVSAVALAMLRAAGLPRLVVYPLYWWPVPLIGILSWKHGAAWNRFAHGVFPFLAADRDGAMPLCSQFIHWHWCAMNAGGGQSFKLIGSYVSGDYIVATINEELGSVILIACAIAYFAFLWAAGNIMLNARDRFGKLLAAGIIAFFEWSAFLNLGMLFNLIPNKGMPLPFVSLGGPGICLILGYVGILISIGRDTVNDLSYPSGPDHTDHRSHPVCAGAGEIHAR